MYIFVLILHIIVSFVLVAVILFQAGKGGGLSETFGGGGGGSQMTIFGQKASAFLTKATTVSAALFLSTSLLLAVLSSKRQKSLMEGVRIPAAGKTVLPKDLTDLVKEAKEAGKTTVKHVTVDPITGKETVTEEETLPATGKETVAGEETLPVEANVQTVKQTETPAPETTLPTQPLPASTEGK